MSLSGSTFSSTRARSIAGIALAALVLAACSTSSGSSGGSFFRPNPNKGVVTVPSDSAYTPEMFLKSGYCPPVEIRTGTESLEVFERGHEDDQNFVRFQGSITQTARECHVISGDTLSVKLGVAGRIAAGPKGTAGNVRATLRVAVVKQNGGTVFYSQPFKVQATVAAPDFAGDFSQVIDGITLTLGPSDRDLIIYVGFDEGKPKPKPNG